MVEVYRKDLATSYTVDNSIDPDTGEVRDLSWYQARGYSTDSSVQGADFGGGSPNESIDKSSDEANRTLDEGVERAKALFSFMPEGVRNEFAAQWVKFGDTTLAKMATRQTPAWKKEFQYLERDDGSLIMSEMEAMATKATYRQTLGEVGIADTSDFEKNFEDMIAGEVSGAEFQQRIDTIWGTVKNSIPQVEQMFREQYGIDTDSHTIFAAFINPEIQDKLLRGDLQSIAIGAEARAAGFTRSFGRFESLRKAGLDQKGARQLYQTAGTYQALGQQTGTEIDIGTLESAAVGDIDATKQVGLLTAEAKAMSSFKPGAKKKEDKVTGLLEN